MQFFSFSESSRFEVKWAGVLKGNQVWYKQVHCNPCYELLIVTDGPVYLQVNQEKLTLHSGECYILTPWQEHQGWNKIDEQHGFIWVQFTAEPALSPVDDPLEICNPIQFVSQSDNDLRTAVNNGIQVILPQRIQTVRRYELMVHFENLLAAMERPQGYFRIRLNILLWSILEIIANDLIRRHQLDSAIPASFTLYRKIVNYLEESYMSDVSKEKLEAGVDRKYEYICNVFKKYSGTTISLYIQQLRIQRAKILLHYSKKSLNEIAIEIGFNDPYYFSRQFKKITGSSPAQFRNNSATSSV